MYHVISESLTVDREFLSIIEPVRPQLVAIVATTFPSAGVRRMWSCVSYERSHTH